MNSEHLSHEHCAQSGTDSILDRRKILHKCFCVFLLKLELAGLCIQALVSYNVFTREHV